MTESTRVTQDFLDSAQYQTETIRRYESVYGEDFVSPGGREMALELIRRLELEPDARVLDVGCGLGGSAFVMAREFALRVDGIDLSKNMLALAQRKLANHGMEALVNLRWGDCLELEAKGIYDAVYSRDVFLHIDDKQRLFTRLSRALRPGGRLLFTDYCCAEKPWSDDFSAYVEARGYCLHTIEAYVELIEGAGFEAVVAEDLSARFGDILRAEITRIEQLDADPGANEKLLQSWRQKLRRSQDGEHRWGLFTAVKVDRNRLTA